MRGSCSFDVAHAGSGSRVGSATLLAVGIGLTSRGGAQAVSLLGGFLVVLGAALPWVETGRVRRSAFTVVRVANEIGVFERTSHRVAVLSLLATPAVASLGLLLLSVGRVRAGAACLLLVGALGLAIGLIGLQFSRGGTSRGGLPGPMVTAVGGACAVAGSLASMRRRRSPQASAARVSVKQDSETMNGDGDE